jgi:hypothetical protein
MLARCYWQLNRPAEAAREFRNAIAAGEANAMYLNLCVSAATARQPTTATHPASAPAQNRG